MYSYKYIPFRKHLVPIYSTYPTSGRVWNWGSIREGRFTKTGVIVEWYITHSGFPKIRYESEHYAITRAQGELYEHSHLDVPDTFQSVKTTDPRSAIYQ